MCVVILLDIANRFNEILNGGFFEEFFGIVSPFREIRRHQSGAMLFQLQKAMHGKITKVNIVAHFRNMIIFFLEIWEMLPPFLQTNCNRAIGIADLQIIRNSVSGKGIDMGIYSPYDQLIQNR